MPVAEDLFSGLRETVPFVDQQHVCMKGFRQRDRRSFIFIRPDTRGSPAVSWISSHAGGVAIQC